jgi:hypothetical protein
VCADTVLVGLRSPTQGRAHVRPPPARLRTQLSLGVPGQVDLRGRTRCRLGQARLWSRPQQHQRRVPQGMAIGLRASLQRHTGQGQPADSDYRAQRGRGELRVPVPAAHLLQGQRKCFGHDTLKQIADGITGHFQGHSQRPRQC